MGFLWWVICDPDFLVGLSGILSDLPCSPISLLSAISCFLPFPVTGWLPSKPFTLNAVLASASQRIQSLDNVLGRSMRKVNQMDETSRRVGFSFSLLLYRNIQGCSLRFLSSHLLVGFRWRRKENSFLFRVKIRPASNLQSVLCSSLENSPIS